VLFRTFIGINTAVVDYAEGGNLETMVLDEDKKVISTWTPEHVLRYAWQVAKAVADLHSAGSLLHGSPAISHLDIAMSQILWMDGMFKVRTVRRVMLARNHLYKLSLC